MKKNILAVLILSAISLGFTSYQVNIPPEALLIEFTTLPNELQLRQIQNVSGVRSIERFDEFKSDYFQRLYHIRLMKFASVKGVRERLQHLGFVKRIDQSFALNSFSVVPSIEKQLPFNDSLSSYQWALAARGQQVLREKDDITSVSAVSNPKFMADVDIVASRDVDQLMQRQVIVAVLDSGLDLKHPDIIQNIYKNEVECDKGEIPFKASLDKDGNGYPGDCMGWNFTTNDLKGNNNPDDDLGHGTHVSGIIAAEKSNHQGVAGLSNRIRILPIKVTSRSDNNGTYHGLTLSDRMTKAILYAIKMKADVINLSLGWPKSLDAEYLRQAVAEAQKAGITVVAAGGNNNHTSPVFPCSYSGVICVGALGIDGRIAQFSNYGGHIDINAPGEEIISLYPRTLNSLAFSVGGYESLSGTSQAAPFVAGAVAILKGTLGQISEDEIKARLFLSANEVSPTEKFTQFGMLKIHQALNLKAQSAVVPEFKSLDRMVYQVSSRRVQFKLPIKNYWLDAQGISVKIRSLSTQFKIESETLKTLNLSRSQAQNILIEGVLTDLSMPGEIHIAVEISGPQLKARSFHHIFQVSRALDQDQSVHHFAVQLKSAKSQFSLLTIRDFDMTGHVPEYYWTESTSDGLKLHLLLLRNERFEEQEVVTYPHMQSLLWIIKAPLFENQSRRGYMISGISQGTDRVKSITYAYLNTDLSVPRNAPEIQFTPETTVIDNAAFAKLNLVSSFLPNQNGATRALPVFLGTGRIPKADLNPDSFEFEINRLEKRVFFFEPRFQDQKWIFITRNFDNYLFKSRLRAQLGLAYKQDLKLVGILPQSRSDISSGLVRILLSYGQSDLKNYVIVKANSTQLMNHEYDLVRTGFQSTQFDNNPINSVVDLSTGESIYNSSAMFSSFITPIKVQLNFLNGDGMQIQNQNMMTSSSSQDYLLGFLQAFKKDDRFYAFLQSKSNLILQTSDSKGVVSRTEESIKRSSLLPGSVFDELFFPVSFRERNSLQPALYVDATQLSSQSVYLWVANEKGLIAPANMNIDVPSNCHALAPQKFSENGDFSFVFLCQKNAGWELQSLMMGTN